MSRTTDPPQAQAQSLETFHRLLDKTTSNSDLARLTAMLQAMEKDWPVAHESPRRDSLADLDERKQLLNDWAVSCRKHVRSNYEPTAMDISLFCVVPISNLREISQQDSSTMLRLVHDIVTKNPYEAILWFLGKGPKRTAAANAAVAFETMPAKKSLPMTADGDPSPPLQANFPEKASLNEPEKREREGAQSPSLPPAKHRRVASDPSQVGGRPPLIIQRPSAMSTAPLASSAPSHTRSKKAVAATLKRDNGKCILTGLVPVEAAHIFPYAATKAPDTALKSIGKLLDLWPKSMAERWVNIIADKTVIESPQNLLCLNRHLHALWDSASFGLKPLTTEDESAATCSVRVQFHWLPRGRFKPMTVVAVKDNEDLQTALCSKNIDDSHVAHRASGVPIESGDIFTITASNPSDLPSVELLNLQWILMQLASMAGFAQLTEDDLWHDTDVDGAAICEETGERDWTVYRGHYVRHWLDTQQSVDEDGRPEVFFGPIASDDEGPEFNDLDQNKPGVRQNSF